MIRGGELYEGLKEKLPDYLLKDMKIMKQFSWRELAK
jgi:hypothetical protein